MQGATLCCWSAGPDFPEIPREVARKAMVLLREAFSVSGLRLCTRRECGWVGGSLA